MTTLEIENLSVRFGGVKALSEVSFAVSARSVHAVIGPNGAGKSTLLNAINGFVPISSGTVSMVNERIDRRSASKIASLGVRRSFQDPRLVESLSVQENLVFGMYDSMSHTWADQLFRPWRSRSDEQEARVRSRELLAAAGLAADADVTVASLPYGVKKLVEILRALMPRPQALLLDEPTSGLSAAERQDLSSMLTKQLAETPTTVMIVEHHMDVVRSVATEVTVLMAGKVVETGAVTGLLASDGEEIHHGTV